MNEAVLLKWSVYLKRCAIRGHDADGSRHTDIKSQKNEEADNVKLELSGDLPHEPCRIRRPNIGEGRMQCNCGPEGEERVCRVHESLFFVSLSGENSKPKVERGYEDETPYRALLCG